MYMQKKQLQKAAKSDYTALVRLAVAEYCGQFGEPDVKKAIKLFQKAVSSRYAKRYGADGAEGDEQDAYCLANCYLGYHGLHQPKLNKKATKQFWSHYKAASRAGDGLANFSLGLIYANGAGTIDADAEKSQKYMQAARESQNVCAVYNDACEELLARKKEWSTANNETVRLLSLVGIGESLRQIRMCADAGSAEAELAIGLALLLGDGVEKDEAEAMRYIMCSYNKKCAMAVYTLGYLCATGSVLAQDPWKAFGYFKESYQWKPSEHNISALGNCYLNGFGCVRSSKRAFECFEKGIALCNGAAMYYGCGIALMRDSGFATAHGKQKGSKSADWYLSVAANAKYAPAQYALGEWNRKNVSDAQALATAREYYETAYKAGYMPAAVALAECLQQDASDPSNDTRAWELLQQAEQAGVADAWLVMARRCEQGNLPDGTATDPELVGLYYRKAAEFGNKDAALVLADAYMDGRYGLEADAEQSYYWKEIAATRGEYALCRKLALAFDKGVKGVSLARNSEKAAYWYAMSALYSPIKRDREKSANKLNDFAVDLEGVWGYKKEVARRIKRQKAEQKRRQREHK